MAKYIGSIEDFLKLFSASLATNSVQRFTKAYKAQYGCQYQKLGLTGNCKGDIEAAHFHGYERPEIVRYILYKLNENTEISFEEFVNNVSSSWNNKEIEIDFHDFMKEFKVFHKDNLEKIIIPLCHFHHHAYDGM